MQKWVSRISHPAVKKKEKKKKKKDRRDYSTKKHVLYRQKLGSDLFAD